MKRYYGLKVVYDGYAAGYSLMRKSATIKDNMKKDSNGAFSMIADYEGDITKLFEGNKDGDMPVLATRNLILFPGVVSPVLIGRTASLSLVNRLKELPDEPFAVFCQKNADEDNPTKKEDLYEYGVYAKIIRVLEMPGGNNNLTVILQGLGRCRLTAIKSTEPYLMGSVEVAPEKIPDTKDKEFMTAVEDLRNVTIDYVKKNDEIPDEAQFALQNINNAVILLNFVCTSLPFETAEKSSCLRPTRLKTACSNCSRFCTVSCNCSI